MGYDDEKQSDRVMFFKDVGLVTFSPFIRKGSGTTEKYITHFDDSFAPVWRYTFDSNIDSDEKDLKQKDVRYIGSDGELIVLLIHGIRNHGKFKPEYMMHFVDSHNGNLIKEVFFPDTEEVAYEVTKCVLSSDSISFTGLYAVGPQWYAHKAGFINEGMFNHTYSRKTLSITERKEITWKQSIGNRFALDKRNGIKDQGYLYAHDFLPLSNGGMIGILEAYELSPVGTNNMYFFELSPDFSLKEVYEAAKPGNRFPEAFSQGTDPKKYGLLDFVDYQNLGDDEFVFFFIDNAKKTKNRKNSSLFGIVSYSDGKFSRQAINLETPGSSIQAINAKKGYLLLAESFKDKKKQRELRLEKINY